MQPTLLKVVSFNVGSAEDWHNLYARSKWKEKAGRDFTPSQDLREQLDALFDFKQAEGITKEQVTQAVASKIDNHLGKLLKEFQPDIVCLQELYYRDKDGVKSAHYPIREFLENRGYALTEDSRPGHEDRAIAYKKATFDCVRTGTLFSETIYEPAYFADLKHRVTGIMIRAVSDHVRGFNSIAQKKHAQKSGPKLPLPQRFEERRKYHERRPQSAEGDCALDSSLQALHELKECPDVVIYGLDANSTSKHSSTDPKERLHPKRVRLFDMYHYTTDATNQNATLIDANDLRPKKYDYIFARCFNSQLKVTITDQLIPGINQPALLQSPGEILSDHLPVLSQVTILRQAAATQSTSQPENPFDSYNQLSAKLEALEKRTEFFRSRLRGVDATLKEIVNTLAEVTEAQIDILESFEKESSAKRDFSLLQALMKQRLEVMKINAIEQYRDLLAATEALEENGHKVLLTKEKREEMLVLFSQKMEAFLALYLHQNGGLRIESAQDCEAIRQKMRTNLDIYQRMHNSQMPIMAEAAKLQQEISKLQKIRETLLSSPLDRWTACARGDVRYLQTEISKCSSIKLLASITGNITPEAFVNAPNKAGSPPLHIACSSRQLEVVQLLLHHGAKVALKDAEGYTPLHRAAQVGDVQIARELMRHGAPVDALGHFDRTPLHMATHNGREEMTRFLLEQGAPINAQTNDEGTRLTPLHDALRKGQLSIAGILIRQPTLDVNLPDLHQHRPLWYAVIDGASVSAALIVGHPKWRSVQHAEDPNHAQQLLKLKIPVNQRIICKMLECMNVEIPSQNIVSVNQTQAKSLPEPLREFVYGLKHFKRCVTKGDGFCAIHALLGEPNENGIIEWKGERNVIGERLRRAWMQKNSALLPQLRAFFEGLSQNVGSRKSEFDPMLTGSSLLRKPLETLQSQLHGSQERNRLLDTFIQDNLEHYLEIFAHQDYYLTHMELEMVAYVSSKNVLLLNRERIVSKKIEEQSVPPEVIVIWHEGLHYERCQRIS
ncbi:MAG: ankyrin repeat domain-containing protein [Parachlamydia sp.]|nr:ankyrin repeat domain-containing protein [Parachlamydia sp.]